MIRRLAPLLVGVFVFVVYLANFRQMGSADTIPTRLLAFSIVREGNLDLDEFYWLRTVVADPYFLQRDHAGHWRSTYPVATSILTAPLAAPLVWWSRAWDISDADSRFRLLVAIFDRVAAALLTAMSVALVFLAGCRIAPARAALAAALFYAFGTNSWATSSQSLWQHGLAQLALAGAVLCAFHRAGRGSALLGGLLVALSIAARPQTALVGAAFLLFYAIERRRDLPYFVAAATPGLIAQLAYNLTFMERVTGGYTARGVRWPDLERLAGVLLSPSRGLLVYCPLAVLAVPAMRRARADEPRVLPYLAGAIGVYVLFYACFVRWWGGHSYGPRFFADVMPLVAVCALPAAQQLWRRTLPRALLIAGACWCVGVQFVGVYFDDDGWNRWPVTVDARRERLWDWSDPQILRALRSGWHGGDLVPLMVQLLRDRTPAPLVPLQWDDLQAAIEPLGPVLLHFRAGRGGRLEVRVTNRAGAVWPAFSDIGDLEVGLSPVWKLNDTVVQGVGEFQPLRGHLAPGTSAEVREWIEAPKHPGRYELELNLVQNLGNAGRFGGSTLRVAAIVE